MDIADNDQHKIEKECRCSFNVTNTNNIKRTLALSFSFLLNMIFS